MRANVGAPPDVLVDIVALARMIPDFVDVDDGAFALPPRITQPPAIDLSNLTKDDLLQLNDVEKDAAILRLSKTVRGMEERRGHRIDKAEFAKWEAEIAEQKQAATAADARAVGAGGTRTAGARGDERARRAPS